MPDQELPDCPHCKHHDRVEKVSALVERIFPATPGDPAARKEYRLVKWGGQPYYVHERYFKWKVPKQYKSHGLAFLISKNSSIKQLLGILLSKTAPVNGNTSNFAPENPTQEAELTGLMLLPILEKPGPLPQNTTFRRFFLEICLYLAWWYVAGLVVAGLGLFLHLLFLLFVVEAYLIFLVGLGVVSALVYKFIVLIVTTLETDYKKKVAKLPRAYERWQKLYYCHYHDGVFTAEGDLPFTHVKRVREMLFK